MINKKKSAIMAGIILLSIIALTNLFDKALATGLLFIYFLSIITLFIIFKLGIKDKELYIIFLFAFLVHLSAVLFIYFTGFRPFGGGADFESYNRTAIEIAHRFSNFNFSFEGIHLIHYFPVLVGIVYSITMPQMIVGQLFTVWLAAFSVLLLYFIVLEIGGSKKAAFLTCLVVTFYPSYLYFGSLLLKDTVVIPLVLAGILLSVKMLKNFTVLKFLLFFAVLTGAIHLRFYVGFALMFSFILSWFLISNLIWKERIIYGLTVVFFLGFSPYFLNYGYYGVTPLLGYLNPGTITVYREVVYAPPPEKIADSDANISECKPTKDCSPQSQSQPQPQPQPIAILEENPPVPDSKPCVLCEQSTDEESGMGSSFVIKAGFENPFTFLINYFESFICSLLGPFFWQLRYKRHLFFLLEIIPWYFFFCVIIYGMCKSIKRYKFAIPIFLFSLMALGALSLFINNYGIITRIRMPMIICLLSITFLAFNDNLEKYYEKIYNNWRSWFYRIRFGR